MVFLHDKNQDKQLLQATSPQPLIDHYNEMLDKVPEIHLAFPKSLAYTLYGYFDAAKLGIDRVDHQQKPQPPIFQAQKAYLQAPWTCLEKRDFQQGLNLSKEARCLAEVPSALPNSFISLSSFDAAIEIGELLNRNPDPNLLPSLHKRLQNFPPTMKVIVAWGLERFHRRSGQIKQAQEMRALLTKFGPHC